MFIETESGFKLEFLLPCARDDKHTPTPIFSELGFLFIIVVIVVIVVCLKQGLAYPSLTSNSVHRQRC